MMKYIFSLALSFILASAAAQTTVQGSIYVSGNDVTIKVKPNQLLTEVAGAITSLNLTISVNANGQPLGNAPVPTSVSSLITGVSVNSVPVEIIDGRFVYIFTLTGGSTNAINWPANTEQDVLFVDFPANGLMTGQFPRLEDQTNNGGGTSQQAYFYCDFEGNDYTNYTNMFYAPAGGSLGNDSNGDQFVIAGTALPIKLGDFSVSHYGERASLLQWNTHREENSDFFAVERSMDTESWVEIGQVSAAGFSTANQKYSYVDAALPNLRSRNEVYYYRLKLTDLDGTFTYSDIRAIDFRNLLSYTIRVFPNPADQLLHADLSGWDTTEEAHIRLFDAAGRVVIEQFDAGQGILPLTTTGLPSGIYHLFVQKGPYQVTERVSIHH